MTEQQTQTPTRKVKITLIEQGKQPIEVEVAAGTSINDAFVDNEVSMKAKGSQRAIVRELGSGQDYEGEGLAQTPVVDGGRYIVSRDVQLG